MLTPLHIYKTLITRGKGVPEHLLASIFNAILEEGIAKVRSVAVGIPQMSNTEGLYRTLVLEHFNKHAIPHKNIELFTKMASYTDNQFWEHFPKEMDELSVKERLLFLSVVHDKPFLPDYTDLPVDKVIMHMPALCSNLKNFLTFGNGTGATQVIVTSSEELHSACAYFGFLTGDKEHIISFKTFANPPA